MLKYIIPLTLSLSCCFFLNLHLYSQPLHTYYFSREIAEACAAGEMRVSKAAQYYSYIGEEQQALSTPNEVPLEWGFDTLTQADIQYFEQFEPQNAVETIVEQAAEEKIIIINEAHHKPRHRVFTRQLLKGLYEQGYRYFGLEALSNCNSMSFCDTLLNQRGYPLNSYLSGTYVTEPQMAAQIREAIAIGFEVFAYESFSKERDLDQAKNIAAFMESHPPGKVLIHCGWYHLLESPNRGRSWMATYLKELTGIDPFTIYQDILIERHCMPESPFFNMVGTYDEPTVFLDKEGQFYNGQTNFDKFDALLYHPRTTYQANRPDWLINLPGYQLHRFDSVGLAYPVLVKAYRLDDTPNAVPADIIEKVAAWDPTALVLPGGEYRLVVENSEGNKEVKTISIE